ncbi:uncharacterized protein LOC112568437 [Pomacea canaliculata]|uniref:uncharacterized protein LOC112568437 n=1 Tax=Pomacea canaliculata TaxID=400727 RepID=UPI000D72969E|nr:uncharacterized protein LOC112568437 [Pomacea canaliculata]
MFTISGKGFSVNKTVNISVVPRPPKLIIGNLIGHFKFEANKTSEIRFSVEDVASYILSYTLFINHKAPGTDISRLKCFLTKTDETCKSSTPDCRCLHGHQYKMAKAFREEDCGEWNFSVAGIGFSVKNGVHISIVAHSPETNQSVELCKLPERSLLKLSIDNTTGPFVIEHNSVSEVCFSVDHVENKLLSYTITINHKAFGTHVSQLKCYLSKTPGKCSSDNEDCECLTEKTGHHQYRLKKVFDYEDSGEWTFTLSGQGLSFERAINITVIPGEYYVDVCLHD